MVQRGWRPARPLVSQTLEIYLMTPLGWRCRKNLLRHLKLQYTAVLCHCLFFENPLKEPSSSVHVLSGWNPRHSMLNRRDDSSVCGL